MVDPAQEDLSCKDKEGVVHGPQESVGTRSDLRAGQKNQEQPQLGEDPVQNLKEPSQQLKNVEDVEQSPSACLNSTSLKNQAAKNSDATKATPLLANADTNAAGENRNHWSCDAGEGSSSGKTSSDGCAIGSAVPSLGSGKKDIVSGRP